MPPTSIGKELDALRSPVAHGLTAAPKACAWRVNEQLVDLHARPQLSVIRDPNSREEAERAVRVAGETGTSLGRDHGLAWFGLGAAVGLAIEAVVEAFSVELHSALGFQSPAGENGTGSTE
jgi:hypothetical protein